VGRGAEEEDAVDDARKPLGGMRLGVLGKGGSGKSTLVVLLAKSLRRLNYEVCVLDSDSTNVGLFRALDLAESPRPLIDHFGGTVFSGGVVTCPVDDPTPLPESDISIENLPAECFGISPEGIYFLVLGKMGQQGPGAGCDGPITKIARDLKISLGAGPVVTLLDFKAGFEDSARGVITGLDWAIMIVDPTSASIQMAIDLKCIVEQINIGVVPATGHLEDRALVEVANRMYKEAKIKGVSYVLNKIDSSGAEHVIRDRLQQGGITPIGVIHNDPVVSDGWLMGVPLDDIHSGQTVTQMLRNLETVIREKRIAA
jgi:CO dehydrogenase nickel-insertion accessory protein CooC1